MRSSQEPAIPDSRAKTNRARPDEPRKWANSDPDVQLMLRFRDGDQDAFAELVARNTPKVHALVYRFLGDPDQVDDLTQEVFLRVYRNAKRYKPTAKFTTWLYRITANLSFNVRRSRRKSRQFQVTGIDEDGENFLQAMPDNSSEAPGDKLDAEELAQALGDAIEDLPQNQKVALVLSRYEGMSYEDIGQVLDCSTMAVKSLLSRARGNLRSSLRKHM